MGVQLSAQGAIIKTAYEAEADTNAYNDAAVTKLAGIETAADVTDATNVAAAGAVMDSDFSGGEGFMRKTGAGAYEVIKSNIGAATAPTVNEDSGDGYAVGSRWLDTTADKEYVCLDATVGAAVWTETTGAGGSGDMLKSTYDPNDDGVIAVAQTEANNYSHPSPPPCRAATAAQTGHATATQITKLDGIATGATKYPDTGEQAFLDADHTKLDAIESGATADQSNAEIVAAVKAVGAIEVDTIGEATGDAGVTVETINLKDGHIGELKKLIFKTPTELTIATGIITTTQSIHTIDTEGDAATDDLVTINGNAGQIIYLGLESAARAVTLKHGTGNLAMESGGDYLFNSTTKVIRLIKFGSWWLANV